MERLRNSVELIITRLDEEVQALQLRGWYHRQIQYENQIKYLPELKAKGGSTMNKKFHYFSIYASCHFRQLITKFH